MVKTPKDQAIRVLKLEPESIFRRYTIHTFGIQNTLADQGWAPRVFATLSYDELKELGEKRLFRSEFFGLHQQIEKEFVGVIMELLPEGWNSKSFFNKYGGTRAWQMNLNFKNVVDQVSKIENFLIQHRIDPGGDLQLYIVRETGRVLLLDFMTYKQDASDFNADKVHQEFRKVLSKLILYLS